MNKARVAEAVRESINTLQRLIYIRRGISRGSLSFDSSWLHEVGQQ